MNENKIIITMLLVGSVLMFILKAMEWHLYG